jgi:nucleotide-binding universal stress UspA family protein
MTRIRHVLCPIDFSDISRHALVHATALAEWYEARLMVLHVVQQRVTELPPVPEVGSGTTLDEMRRFTADLSSEVSLVLTVEEAESVHDAIVARADAFGADLLVIGTHGHSGFRRLIFGSVTEKVLQEAACPVLIVPPRAPEAPKMPIEFRQILCPVEFSDDSLDAVAFALELAQEADARLTLLHAVDIPPAVRQEVAVAIDTTAIEADARHRLLQLIPESARQFCTVETVVTEGEPHAEILRQATARAVDLIVMAGHSRPRLLDRMHFGSTTHHVMREAPCPVLVLTHR